MAPKAFISHASEDKDRFVTQFATKLREKGVDAWLDKWEMLPGDKLVDKIFNQGIKDAAFIIVVVSNSSITKPWVKEEIDSAFIKRIEKNIKIIPVIIDKCEVPEALKTTLYEKITDLNSYEENLARIISSIFGVSDKPPIGSAPSFTNLDIKDIDGISPQDNLVLKLSGDYLVEHTESHVNPKEVFNKNSSYFSSEEAFIESLEVLDGDGYISLLPVIGSSPINNHFTVTLKGFDLYANTYITDYSKITYNIVASIVNENMMENQQIAKALNLNVVIVDHILDLLENNNFIQLSKTIGVLSHIYNVSPKLKRLLK